MSDRPPVPESAGPPEQTPGSIERAPEEPIDIQPTLVEPGEAPPQGRTPARPRVTVTSHVTFRARRVGPDGEEIWSKESDGKAARRILLLFVLVSILLMCLGVYFVFYLLLR